MRISDWSSDVCSSDLALSPAAGSPAAVVYIIEGGRLLTFSAGDYARGEGAALAGVTLPAAPASHLLPNARVPRVTDQLYRRPPDAAAGGGGEAQIGRAHV